MAADDQPAGLEGAAFGPSRRQTRPADVAPASLMRLGFAPGPAVHRGEVHLEFTGFL